jgi:hypothetical protein
MLESSRVLGGELDELRGVCFAACRLVADIRANQKAPRKVQHQKFLATAPMHQTRTLHAQSPPRYAPSPPPVACLSDLSFGPFPGPLAAEMARTHNSN